MIIEDDNNVNKSTIYGPVKSWRFGDSVGIDLLFHISTCSFNCIYCQLGYIQQITTERKIYVSTQQVIEDWQNFILQDKHYDVITFSGSGEPTLALNLGEIIQYLKAESPNKSQQILTNSTLMGDEDVIQSLNMMDRVIAKIDAPNQYLLEMINRADQSLNMDKIIADIIGFAKQYKGIMDIQMMWTAANINYIDEYIDILKAIQPHHIQLNTPTRPYPLSWHRENRGNHTPHRDYPSRTLSPITPAQAFAIESKLSHALPNSEIISIYRKTS